ncbi:uncharacterized protein RCC_00476 [Ramularia collo-cygni]|uniref:Transcriptional coactivator HFI1/ADA1 n=1 Tax=Ramularia collo-cygni TaxID=112498 RepID=A0A2D3UN07_9PEZI|nr:uncharacterized protein RCC_00476 [Ramularia collo-cygni]CZT14498.1 uncharacterized protein RCC_00476 [Ramularia collo-cygni]
MNPADLTISPYQSKVAPAASSSGQKNGASGGKVQVERVNVEPMYKQLQKVLGKDWEAYRTALKDFVLGNLSQNELSYFLQPMFVAAAAAAAASSSTSSSSSSAAVESFRTPAAVTNLHNCFFISVFSNCQRDPPPTEVAPWVVATDKPTATAKSAGAGSGANDKAEERLRHEVMHVHARDRKRIKLSKEPAYPVNDGLRDMQEYRNELGIHQRQQAQQVEPQSATGTGPSGLAKTNWDVEIRRRYAQPLASELLEFPSLHEIQSRIEPICYEEGLTNGVQQGAMQACAELVEQATEVCVKEMIGALLNQVRSNAVGGRGGIQTTKFQRQLRKEEEDVEVGIVQRTAGGLLPVEVEAQLKQKPVSMQDLSLAAGLSNTYLRRDRFLQERVHLHRYPQQSYNNVNGHGSGNPFGLVNGAAADHDQVSEDDDAMVIDDNEYGALKGTDETDYQGAMSALDECLQSSVG